jgi:DNA repair protein RadD
VSQNQIDLLAQAPAPITPHDFQLDVIDGLTTEAENGARRLLLQSATGSGKTVIASKIIHHATSNNFNVLFLAHRRELVFQCSKKLESFGVPHGVLISGEPYDPTRLVTVASIQTLHARAIKRKREVMPKADIVVVDEAHHTNTSKTWQDILNLYPNALVLGMTATPINRRGRGLGHHYDAMVCGPSIPWLIEHGYLVPARYFVPSPVDLKGLRIVAGDYVEDELEQRMDVPKLIGDIVENWARLGEGRQTLVFASGVKHSLHLMDAFKQAGVTAAHVDGETPKDERDKTLADFAAGKIKVLCNCAVFTEGTDIPSASCLVFARPTKSLLLYLQVAGRVLRTFPGKKDCVILDHAGVVYEHGQVAQEWEWKLDYGGSDVQQATQRKVKTPKEIVCGKCKAAYWGRLDCPECGWRPEIKGKEIRTYDAYLQALEEIANPPPVDEKTFYQMMLGYCAEKGKKPGFAFFKFQDRFNKKPQWAWRELPPIEPNAEVRAWLRKQNAAYFWKQKNPELAAKLEAQQK